MKVPYEYELYNGKVVKVKVSAAVAAALAGFKREDKNEARYSRRRNNASIENLYEESGWEPVDLAVDIEESYIVSEEKESVFAAVTGLSEKQRRLVQLYYYEGKTFREIGEVLGIHFSCVQRQLETIHKILKKYF